MVMSYMADNSQSHSKSRKLYTMPKNFKLSVQYVMYLQTNIDIFFKSEFLGIVSAKMIEIFHC